MLRSHSRAGLGVLRIDPAGSSIPYCAVTCARTGGRSGRTSSPAGYAAADSPRSLRTLGCLREAPGAFARYPLAMVVPAMGHPTRSPCARTAPPPTRRPLPASGVSLPLAAHPSGPFGPERRAPSLRVARLQPALRPGPNHLTPQPSLRSLGLSEFSGGGGQSCPHCHE